MGTGLADRVDRGSLQPSGLSHGPLSLDSISIGKAALTSQAVLSVLFATVARGGRHSDSPAFGTTAGSKPEYA